MYTSAEIWPLFMVPDLAAKKGHKGEESLEGLWLKCAVATLKPCAVQTQVQACLAGHLHHLLQAWAQACLAGAQRTGEPLVRPIGR
jgi:hypothetical protein